jgi:hypothetical protein
MLRSSSTMRILGFMISVLHILAGAKLL